MKKIIFIYVIFIIFGTVAYTDNILSDEVADKLIKARGISDEIKYLKPDEEIHSPMEGSSSGYKMPEDKNKIVAIKDADENHVKVVSRLNGLTYPDVELEPSTGSDFVRNNIMNVGFVLFGKQNGKWGAIDRQGKILVPFKFERKTTPTGFGYFKILDREDNNRAKCKETLIDKDCNLLFPFIYTYVFPVNEHYCKAVGLDGVKLVNLKGEDVFGGKYKFSNVEYISDDFIIANICTEEKHTKKNHINQGVLLNINGEILYKGDFLSPIGYDEKYRNYSGYHTNLFAEIKEDKIKDSDIKNGQLPDNLKKYESLRNAKVFIDGLERVYYFGNTIKILDGKCNVILDNVKSYRGYRNSVVCEVESENGKKVFVFLDKNGETDGKEWTEITDKYNNFNLLEYKSGFVVTIDKKRGFIDVKGNEIVPLVYDNILRPMSGVSEKTESNYIGFVSEGKSLVLNLDTFEKKEYNETIVQIDNKGVAYKEIKEKAVFNGKEREIHRFVPIE